jgi:hypothetical protein
MKANYQSPSNNPSRTPSPLHKLPKAGVISNDQLDAKHQEEVDAEYDHFIETWESFREFNIHG